MSLGGTDTLITTRASRQTTTRLPSRKWDNLARKRKRQSIEAQHEQTSRQCIRYDVISVTYFLRRSVLIFITSR